MENQQKLLHVFIIPDGNRRWAKDKGLAPWEGHRQGYEILRSVLKKIWSLEVTHFTFWGLSMDNFRNRSPEEIGVILQLFEQAIDELLISPALEEEKIRIRIVGKLEEYYDNFLKEKIARLEKKTASYPDKNFTLLFGYNGDDELSEAITLFYEKALIDRPARNPISKLIFLDTIRNCLWTHFLPDVDILIRTGFEPHLSAAALSMQMANAHLYFPQMHWPDFTIEELTKIIDDFKNRGRRFGA